MGTKDTLVAELEKLPASKHRDTIIARAKAGTYHDFESEVDLPKIMLVTDLRRAGFDELAQQVMNGAFDDKLTARHGQQLADKIGANSPALAAAIRKQGRQLELEEQVRAVARRLKIDLPEHVGFVLVLFDYGEAGSMSYASTGDRGDCIRLLRELIGYLEEEVRRG
jgi:hypothetical protein